MFIEYQMISQMILYILPSYKPLCKEAQPDSKYLFGSNLSERIKMLNQTFSLNQTVSMTNPKFAFWLLLPSTHTGVIPQTQPVEI